MDKFEDAAVKVEMQPEEDENDVVQLSSEQPKEEDEEEKVSLDLTILNSDKKALRELRQQIAMDEERKKSSIRDWFKNMSERLSADIQTFEQKVAIRDKWLKKLLDGKNEMKKEKQKV